MIGYSEDFYGWTLEQAELLLNAQFNNLDIPNLIREIISMGRNEKREAENRLAMLLAHLLIWERHIERRQAERRSPFKRENQLERRSKSRHEIIKELRIVYAYLLRDNPGLKPYQEDILSSAYKLARTKAAKDTGLDMDVFEPICLWTLDQITDYNFYPN
ncbi:MAG: DUF29 domain-containing protein [Halobacteriota archaeon]